MLSRFCQIFTGSLCCLLLAGCGNGLPTLQGTVTVDGQPAPNGISLSFSPISDTGATSYATTEANGAYEASYTFQEKGITEGEHIVALVPGGGAVPESMPEIGPNGKPVPGSQEKPPEFPKEYYQEIERITIEPGSNQIDIDLSTKK